MDNDWPDPPNEPNDRSTDGNAGNFRPVFVGLIGCGLNFFMPAVSFLSATKHATYPKPFGLTMFLAVVSLITAVFGLPMGFNWKQRSIGWRVLAVTLSLLPLFVGIGSMELFSKITGIVIEN
jgi:hypothetical protein